MKDNQPTVPNQTPAPAAKRTSVFARLRRMGLQTRLVIFILIATIPVIMLVSTLLTQRVATFVEEEAISQLSTVGSAVDDKVSQWLDMNYAALYSLIALPDVISMDPALQKPMLQTIQKAYPHLFLVHTMDTTGQNVARNDDNKLLNYQDRTWFQGAMEGHPVTMEVVMSKTINRPVLAMAMPIRNDVGKIIGIGSVTATLESVSKEIVAQSTSNIFIRDGFILVVDDHNHVIAHPKAYVTDQLLEMNDYPPIVALRSGTTGHYHFTDENGVAYLTYLIKMDNGWGIVVHKPESIILAPVQQIRTLIWVIMLAASFFLIILNVVGVRELVRPIFELTETVAAITKGDLNRTAIVRREDEVGALAAAFNTMTTQLRDLIGSLEGRVEERTRALATALEVSRKLSTILDQDELVTAVVQQLKSSFGYYHAQIYLFDPKQENLVMVGGTGEAGGMMMERGHSIPRGKGLVGRAAETKTSVLVGDVSSEPGWLPNPLLPETRAEAVVPVLIGDQVMGVLDVQQSTVGGLSQADLDVLALIAGQVAVALQNTQSYAEARRRADRETRAAEIRQKIRGTTTVEDALKVTVRELGHALGASQTTVKLEPQKPPNGHN